MLWINRILALALIAGVIPLWRQSTEFPGTATTFPKITLLVMALLAVILLAVSFRAATKSKDGEGRMSPVAVLRPGAVFAVSLAGVYVTQFVGFFLSMLGVSTLLYFLLGVSRPVMYTVTIVLLLISVYLVFVMALGVPLMNGLLWQT